MESIELRVPLEEYLGGKPTKVFSLVASVPYSPVDIDLNLLVRSKWNALGDRMRFWFLPKGEGRGDKSSCYFMIRKFDQEQGIVICVHIVANLDAGAGQDLFTLGILSNDDVRARALLGIFLGVPPIFHERSELVLVEERWRTEPDPVMRFMANVHSALASMTDSGGKVYNLKIEPPADLLASIKPNLENWWKSPQDLP
jgi:hypothetical protein